MGLLWDDMPVRVFFGCHPCHGQAAKPIRGIPFDRTEMPVLACEDLVMFEALFTPAKGWAEAETIGGAGAVAIEAACCPGRRFSARPARYERLLVVADAGSAGCQPGSSDPSNGVRSCGT